MSAGSTRSFVTRGAFGALFGALFAAALPPLASSSGLTLLEPVWRWLACGLCLLWMPGLGALWDASRWQRWSTLSFRTVGALSLVVALTQPTRVERSERPLAVIMLEDHSPSVDLRSDEPGGLSEEWKKALEQAGIPIQVVPVGVKSEGSLRGGARLSDLNRHLQHLGAWISPDRETRVVLRTDGGHSGDTLAPSLRQLRRAGLQIYQMPSRSRLDKGDVAVLDIKVPTRIATGVTFRLEAPVSHPEGRAVRCQLWIQGEERGEALVLNGVVAFKDLKIKTPDPHFVRITCAFQDMAHDAVQENNTALSIIVPEQPKRILLVDSQPHKARVLKEALGPNYEITIRGPSGIPDRADKWDHFDAVFISDLPRISNFSTNNFTTRQMKMADRYVRRGGSLIFVGGPKALGLGRFVGTWLERRLLPVWLDQPQDVQLPQLALVLVIDCSGSMSGTKLRLAKEAAIGTAESLGSNDRIGVVTFDDRPSTVVELQRAANRFRIRDDISRVRSGGGTQIKPALRRALAMLKSTRARFKHVILLSDGRSPPAGVLDSVQAMVERDITVSSVAVGRSSDRRLLREIAETGLGRYHFTDNPRQIPRIFLKEAKKAKRSTAHTGRFRPQITASGRRDSGLRRLSKALPNLNGLVITRPKKNAKVLLKHPGGQPLLVRARKGAGQIIVFTSDLKGVWSRAWLNSPAYARFWRSLVKDSGRETSGQLPTLEVIDRGDSWLIRARYSLNEKKIDRAKARSAQVSAAGIEEWSDLKLQRVGPGLLEGVIKGDGPGSLLIELSPTPDDPRGPVLRATGVRSYDREIDPRVLRDGRAQLSRLAKQGLLPQITKEALLAPAQNQDERRVELWPLWVFGFLFSWLIGLVLRRIPLSRAPVERWW